MKIRQMQCVSIMYILSLGAMFLPTCFLYGQPATASHDKILFISSYTSDTKYIYSTISDFINGYKASGGDSDVIVENMNVNSFSQATLWRDKFIKILEKHNDANLIVLLGGEAWSCYLSLTDEKHKKIPIMCAMTAAHGITLPTLQDSLSTYQPKCINLVKEMQQHPNVMCAIAYDYDVDKNTQLINDFYPEARNVAFISDNTYNGVAQMTYVREKLEKKHSNIKTIFIDGRTLNLDEATLIYRKLPPHTVTLLGTWRMDREDNSYMNNSGFAFNNVNNSIPVFSLTGSSIHNWAIGGYVPIYDGVGQKLGQKAYQLLIQKQFYPEFVILPNHYQFDVQKLKELGFTNKSLPSNSELINQEPSFFDIYLYEMTITITIFIILLIGISISSYFYFKTRMLSHRLQSSSEVLRTEKKRLEVSEAKLRAAKEHAEEANRIKSTFVSNMSHEIRTPLNAIVGFSSLLVGTIEVSDEQKEYTKIIETNSNLLLQLINDVLNISRLESNTLQFKCEWCEVIEHCRNIILLIDHNKKVDVKLRFTPFESTYKLHTDPLRLQQIITNLLNNALKFTPANGSITLAIEKDDANRQLLFSVTDTGCGIPENKQEAVFNRFEKLNEFVQGTGLGLSICRLIIQRMRGEIWIDKNYKNGARFVFSHPITE